MEDAPRDAFKKLIPRYVFIGIFALLLLRTGGASAAALTQKQAMGSDIPSHKLRVAYTLSATAAISSNDVWTVGSQKVGEQNAQPMIQHWDGSQWSVVPSPDPGEYGELSAIAAISANDIWAVGSVIEHWDGTSWSNVTFPPPPGASSSMLNAVAASSSTDVWAVGVYQAGPKFYPLIEHWDGTAWSIVPGPNVRSKYASLSAVTAFSANNAWAVGWAIDHWNGQQWKFCQPAYPLHGMTAISAKNMWAVGRGGGTDRFNGKRWLKVPFPPPPNGSPELYGVSADSATDVWTVGDTTTGGSAYDTLTAVYC